MHVLSLFDGISCGMVALERSGILVEKYHAYEIDKYATAISKKIIPKLIITVMFFTEISENTRTAICLSAVHRVHTGA